MTSDAATLDAARAIVADVRAALAPALARAAEVTQQGRAIDEAQVLTQRIASLAAQVTAAEVLVAYAAARAFDTRSMLPSMAKFLACDVAGEVTRTAQVLHGGWGYFEEGPISRYVLDTLVLPIFEGAKAVLELRVIGRALLAGEA